MMHFPVLFYKMSVSFRSSFRPVLLVGVVALLPFLLPQCTKDRALLVDPGVNCDTVPVSFSADITPLFETKCSSGLGPGTGCHDSWSGNWDIYNSKNEGGRIENYVLSMRSMPPEGNDFNIAPLTEEELQLVNCWIYDGWPNN